MRTRPALFAKGSPFGRAVERSETERVLPGSHPLPPGDKKGNSWTERVHLPKHKKRPQFSLRAFGFMRKPQAMLVGEKSRSVETVEKEPPFAIIRSG